MNSIYFHFNGDVNINLSLPDSADRPGYKKLVDCLEVVSDDALDVAGLAIVFDGRRVLNLGRERYLLGPVIVYKYDEDGDGVSLSSEDVIAAVVYFADNTVTGVSI